MKKMLVISLVIVSMIITIIPVSASGSILLGDIDRDGYVSVIDARTALRAAAGLEDIAENALIYADVDFDGRIATDDAREILKIAANISPQKTIEFSEWITVVEPTCTSEGKAVSYSSLGNYQNVKILPRLEHDVVEATCEDGAYCSVCFTYVSDPLGHNIEFGTCTRCNMVVQATPIISVCNKSIFFGFTPDEIIRIYGQPTEILTDNTKSYSSVKYYVYANDYSKLTIFTVVDEGLAGIFSFDPTLTVNTITADSATRVTFDNVDSFYYLDGVYYEAYIDKIGTGEVYAFHATTCKETTKMYETTNFRSSERLVFHMLNACRAINNLQPLKYSEPVANVALSHSKDMAENNYFAHKDLLGQSSYMRLVAAGIRFGVSGENIAAGQATSPYDFNNLWYNSSGHRSIMLSSSFAEIGIGFAYCQTSDYGFYGTQDYISY